MSPTGRPVVLDPVWPNAGVQAWYQARLDEEIAKMYFSSREVILAAAADTPAVIATDAKPPTAAGVIFRDGDNILLMLRNDGTGWAFPGGTIEPGETPEEAARREVYEECELTYLGDLKLERVQSFGDVRFATFVADYHGFAPRLNDEHTRYMWVTVPDALRMRLHPGVRETLESFVVDMASDATPTKTLQRALEKWGAQWIQKFDLMAQSLSLDFAARNQRATETAMMGSLKKAGFTVAFKTTRKSIEAYRVVAAEQVGLIKSIAQKYHSDIQTQVWQSVKRGADLKTLSKHLSDTYGVTRRRAALIARDQNAKAKATIEAVRHQELGIKQAIWMHSHAGKEPRPTHVKMNNKIYDLDRGMWDSDEQKFVHPGELINCRCTMRPYIPGFETVAYPEWDIVQT